MKPWLSLLLGCFLSKAIAVPIQAQITPDGTTNTVISPTNNGTIIEAGDRLDNNLFHSFDEFSVPNGSEVLFNNPQEIVNIFSRVTGGKISDIDGLIGANGGANLFLINPAGIVFGEGAALNLGGSFVASTADSIVFSDEVEFSATDTTDPPLLTINQPLGLNFGNSAGDIEVNGSSLQVDDGETLALLGGNTSITEAEIIAPGGRVEIGSLGDNSLVRLTAVNPDWLFDYQNVNNFQNLRLSDNTEIAVNGDGNGSIALNANNIELLSGSSLQAGIDTGFSLDASAREIALNAQDTILIDNSAIINEVQEEAVGNGGDIRLTGRSLFLDNGAILSANSWGRGNTGNILINASELFSYDGAGDSEATVISATLLGTGNGGQIRVDAPEVFLFDGATIVAHTFGNGNAGNIEINATDRIALDGVDSGVGSQVLSDAVGNGGTIVFDAPEVSVTNGATVVAHTNSRGNAGNINLSANRVILDGVGSNGASSGIGSAAFELADGGGGEIAIDTQSLAVTNGATLFGSSFATGDAGKITVNATGAVTFDGIGTNGLSSNAFSTVEASSQGDGRAIAINADSLTVANGAVIGVSTSGRGEGGEIELNVNSLEILNGGQALTTSRGSGDAGDIVVNVSDRVSIAGRDENFAERLARIGRPLVRNQGAASGIFANSDLDSTGSGGNIQLTAQDLFLDDGGAIDATNQGDGTAGRTGGNINLQVADNLTLENNSLISAQALKNANGGNIAIDAGFVIAVPNQNNDIIAAAARGVGGNIDLTTNGIFGIQERSSTPANNTNDIDASSEFGLDGTIAINELDVNPVEALEELPIEIIDVTELVAQNLCQQGQGSEFIVTGKGGVAPSPVRTRNGEINEVDLVQPASNFESDLTSRDEQPFAPIETNEIIEAQGWIINDRGNLELIAQKTDAHSYPQIKNNRFCHNH